MKKHLLAIAIIFAIVGGSTFLMDEYPSAVVISPTNSGEQVLGANVEKSPPGKCGDTFCSQDEICINHESNPTCAIPRALPSAKDDTFRTGINTAVKGNVLKNDDASKEMTAKTITGVTHGKLILKEYGLFDYKPEKGYTGKDSFTYKTCLAKNQCSAPATVTIEIR